MENKKIMVLTSMRTGSTWLTFLVKYLTGRNAGFAKSLKDAEQIWNRNDFVKAHIFTPEQVFEKYPDAYIITSVRNPKGRIASLYYFKPPYNKNRLTKILRGSLRKGEKKQLNRMWEGYSSNRTNWNKEPHYLWIPYEWMKKDIYKEAKAICEFLDLNRNPSEIQTAITRAKGETVQRGVLRKGKIDGWKDEKFVNKLLVLDKYQEMYYNKVNQALGKEE